MASIDLATKYLPFTDEIFTTESRISLLTTDHFTWESASTVKIYKITTSAMNDYGRAGPTPGVWSRYGPVEGLDATTQSMTLRKDRSFTFAVDALDADETVQQLQGASALARQIREVVIPEIDRWAYQEMTANAGQNESGALTVANIYQSVIAAKNALDEAEVPETGRFLLVTPNTFALMKQAELIIMMTEIGQDMRLRGVIATLDGMEVVRVPANRLPEDFGFLAGHPVATVAPVKLSSYRIHENPPGINGALVEGRFNYDAFVLDNKAKALYYHKNDEPTPVEP